MLQHTRPYPRTHTCTRNLFVFSLLFPFLKNKNKALYTLRNGFSGQLLEAPWAARTHTRLTPTQSHCTLRTLELTAHTGTILQSSAGTSAGKRVTRRRGTRAVRVRPLQVLEQDWAGTGRRSHAPSLSLRPAARPPPARPPRPAGRSQGCCTEDRGNETLTLRSLPPPPPPQVSTRSRRRCFLSRCWAYPGGRKLSGDISLLLLPSPASLPLLRRDGMRIERLNSIKRI